MLQCIFEAGSTTRADIARTTGLTPATVSDLVGELVEEGLVSELGVGPSAGGKPPTLLGLRADARSVIALDLSDGGQLGSVVDLQGSVVHQASPWKPAKHGEAGVRQVVETIAELVDAAPAPILGIGVGTPGVVDFGGTVLEAANLGWRNLPLASLLADRFEVPVHVINNSRAAALAEFSFGDHEAENLIAVKIGNGIGAGVVLDGRIHQGEDSAAGEIGHVAVDPEGRPCSCGRVGCLETIASIPSLVRALKDLIPGDNPQAVDVLAAAAMAADQREPRVLKILDEAGRNLGRVLSTMVAVLDIHLVVLTGHIARLGDLFLARVGGEIERRVLPSLAAKLELRYGTMGDRAVRLGAAGLVLNRELGVL